MICPKCNSNEIEYLKSIDEYYCPLCCYNFRNYAEHGCYDYIRYADEREFYLLLNQLPHERLIKWLKKL
jgi:hypothetical protein